MVRSNPPTRARARRTCRRPSPSQTTTERRQRSPRARRRAALWRCCLIDFLSDAWSPPCLERADPSRGAARLLDRRRGVPQRGHGQPAAQGDVARVGHRARVGAERGAHRHHLRGRPCVGTTSGARWLPPLCRARRVQPRCARGQQGDAQGLEPPPSCGVRLGEALLRPGLNLGALQLRAIEDAGRPVVDHADRDRHHRHGRSGIAVGVRHRGLLQVPRLQDLEAAVGRSRQRPRRGPAHPERAGHAQHLDHPLLALAGDDEQRHALRASDPADQRFTDVGAAGSPRSRRAPPRSSRSAWPTCRPGSARHPS